MGQFAQQPVELRPVCAELLATSRLVVFKFEARTHRTSKQRPLAARHQSRTLPHAARNHHLRPLSLRPTVANANDRTASIRAELQHLHRIACIEMEYLIGLQPMHLAERAALQQVVDRGARMPRSRIAPICEYLRRHPFPGLVGANVEAAFAGMRY